MQCLANGRYDSSSMCSVAGSAKNSAFAGTRQSCMQRKRMRCSQQRQLRQRHSIVTASGLSPGHSKIGVDQQANRLAYKVKGKLWNMAEQLGQSPPANALRSLQALLWMRIQPVYSVIAAVVADVADQYDEFLGEETKRKWEWKRRAEQERAFWGAAVIFVATCGLTLLWEVLVPVSFLWAVAVPVHCAWSLYDRPLFNPISVGLLLMLPLKFYPGGPFRWI